MSYFKFFCLIFLATLQSGYSQSVDTTLEFQTIEIVAPRLKSFQTGKKQTPFNSFQKLATATEDLATALSLNTPIFIKNYGPGRLATTAIRGAGAAQTAVIWNGFNLNSPMLGQTDFSLVPAFFMDEIGLQYGSNSTAWGSGAIGGSVILENKNNFNKGWQAVWDSKTGSFDNFFNGIGVGYSNDSFSTTTKVLYESGKNDFPIENGQADRLLHSELSKWGVLQKNGFKINDQQQLDLNVWYQTTDRNLPPNLVQRNSEATQADESLRTTLNWKYVANNSVIQVRNGLFYDRLFFQDISASIDSRSRTWTNRSEVEWTKTISSNHSLNIGANYAYLKAKSTGYASNPNQQRAAIFAMYHWKNSNEKWQGQLSLRQEWVDGAATPFIPSLGFSGKLSEQISLNGNIAKSYRVPTFNDLFWENQGNQNLLSEDGWNQELGLAYRIYPKWQFTTTVYNRSIDNWLLWQPENGVFRPSNLLKVWSRGLENILKGQKQIGEVQLDFSLQYDLTLSTNRKATSVNDASVGKQLIYVPKHKLNMMLQANWKDWTLAFYHLYTGKVYTLKDNSESLPAYHLDHLFLYKRWKASNLEGNVFVKANNILGVNYQVIAQFPMPQRSFELGWKINLISRR